MLNDYEKKHLRQLRKEIAGCTLFLKRNRDFPLKAPCEIGLYGSGARRTVRGGTGSGEVNNRFNVSIEKGLEKAGFTITTGEWLDSYDTIRKQAHKLFVKETKKRMRSMGPMGAMAAMGSFMSEPEYDLPIGEGEVAVYVLSRNSGEGTDRTAVKGDILLTDTEVRDIHEIAENYRRFMLVLNVGGPVDLRPVSDIKNILLFSQLGAGAGVTFADILLGRSNPSGKLATTWTTWSDYPVVGTFGDRDDTYYDEGIYVGYRYFDSANIRPMFPFGFGLSYTDYSHADPKVTVKGTKVMIKAGVKNVGKFPGREVMQAYVTKPAGKLDQPYQVLAGFDKTPEIEPGGTGEALIRFDLRDLTSYDSESEAYILEKGDYILRVGPDSKNTQICGVLRLDGDATVRKVKNSCGEVDITDWKPARKRRVSVPDDVQIFDVKAEEIECETVSYRIRQKIEPEIDALSDETLAYLNVGAFKENGAVASVIGNAGFSVAGAAGQSYLGLEEQGIPSIIMADGPAGLRLSRDYVLAKGGAVSIGNTIPESIMEFLPAPAAGALRAKNSATYAANKKKIRHQYATAIPIGTAIAQSWDVKFARMCGDIVGDEMVRFGVDLWLAPALNIHRDIRCGRNFEYYSEDPLISGRIAAAITTGVQAHKGCGVTIKHFAANNQETNRYNNNSIVSERAMREIYLKGFEICVKESAPKTVMTSYNLLNGVHTSEHRGLIYDILRCEWGFKGVVMTDWIVVGGTLDKSSLHRAPMAELIAAAGSELVMPGSKGDVERILGGIYDGSLSRDQLKKNATRVLLLAKELKDK